MKQGLTAILISITTVLFAQVDKKWICGYAPVIMEFSEDSTFTYPVDTNLLILYITETDANICDTNGNLQFFSNGMCLFDKHGDTMENAYGFHPPKIANFYGVDATSSQAALIVPKKDNLYYYFHYSMSDSNFVHYRPFDLLYYSLVDMEANGGKGKVFSKNNVLIKDSLLNAYGLTATRHANGRDWWLIKADYLKNGYYIFLVTPDTITGPVHQIMEPGNFGTPTPDGQCIFSQDGSKMAATNFKGGVKVMNFDRCTGVLTLDLSLTLPYDSVTQLGIGGSGIAFSASGRFLYANTFRKVYQFDLENANVQTSCTFIGEEDTVLTTGMDREGLAPDGRIYLANFNGFTNTLSVIDSPEIKGIGCNFSYHSVVLHGGLAAVSIPNMINYHLGKLAGSDCDTITAIEKLTASNERCVAVYPNPAHDYVNVVVDETMLGALLIVTDVTGRKVMAVQLQTTNSKLETTRFARGVYFIVVKTKDGEWKDKLVVE